MDNTAPFEIIAAPFTAWLAAEGTAFPDPDEEPGVAWTKLGTSGDLNYTEDGVTVQHGQTVEKFRSLGSTGPRKAFRTEEEMMVSLTLADVSLEQYRVAMNHNTLTDTAAGAGTPGERKIGLTRGLLVTRKALLVRGPSPYGDDMAMQYEVPVVIVEGEPELVYRKGEPAALKIEFSAMEDPNAASTDERFGRLVAQDAEAGT
jgi:hypothetical protein